MEPFVEDFLTEAEGFKFNFKPVLFNPEKRGHLYSSSLFTQLQQQNLKTENYEDQIDISYAVECITEELNNLLEDLPRLPSDHPLRKVSRFEDNNGVINCFLSDKQTIDELIESTKEIINSDDEFNQKSTDSTEFAHDESSESEKDDHPVSGANDAIVGVVQSVFREVNGVPTEINFVPKAVAKIQLNDSHFETISKSIGDSRYVWIQHIFQNQWDYQEITDDSEYVETLRDSDKVVESQMTWSLVQILNFTDKTIWISGVKVLHNTPVYDICTLESQLVLESFKTNPHTCSFSTKLAQQLLQIRDKAYSLEDIVTEEIEKYLNQTKTVTYTDSVMKDLTNIVSQGKLDFYSSVDEVITSINVVLSMNPVALTTQTKKLQRNISAIAFDNLMVIYEKVGEIINVFKIIWSTFYVETGTQHTKQWLDSLCQILDLENLALSN